jgi:hypothetical protein
MLISGEVKAPYGLKYGRKIEGQRSRWANTYLEYIDP